ncbi:MAG: hypothetical protein ACTSYB_03145 [Candidatus Helarchaeota archaeon]
MSISSPEFGYPRALFDPHYIPPKLLHRNKELKLITNLFRSSLEPDDQYLLNAFIHGIRGVGKTVFTNYSINYLKSNSGHQFTSIYLDMSIKSPYENLRLLVELYSQLLSQKYVYLRDSKDLWSYFLYLRNKNTTPLILIFDNVDSSNLELYLKILRIAKSLNLSTIAISQKPPHALKEKLNSLTDQLNLELKLEIYSSSALLDILTQRITLAFPTARINPTYSRYIVDIVTHFDNFRPSTCIDILKTFYQHFIEGLDITPTLIRDASFHLLEFPFRDDLEFLLWFDDSPINLFYLPLIEKLAIYFKNKENVYISQDELFNLYKLTCDELMSPYNRDQFQQFFDFLLTNGFLYPSQFKLKNKELLFFMILDPDRFLDYLEIKFSKKLD